MSSRRLILKGAATKMLQRLLPPKVKDLLSGGGLKARVARGGVWVGAASAFDQGSRLVRNMVLTRLLAPEAFGLMAIVLAVNTLFDSFTDVGIDTAIVQSPRSEMRTYLNGAWWVSLGRSLALYSLAFAAAPWLSRFYDQPSLTALVRVAFLGLLFRGAISPRAYVAHKKMDFKRLVAINQGAGVCGVLASVFLAIAMRDVWALAIGFAVESGMRCILSYILCPFRPGLEFDRASLHELYRYSRGMFGLPILTFIYLRADIFVIGKLASAALLGIYSMAASLGRMPLSLAGTPLAQVIDPAFSELQGDNEKLRSSLLKITSAVAMLICPAMIFVALYARDLLLVLFGRPYVEAAAPLALLFASAMLGVASIPVVSLYFMTGRPHLNRSFTIVRVLFIIGLMYPATKFYGLTGAAAAALASMVFACVLQLSRLREIVGLGVRQYARAFASGVPVSLPVVVFWGAASYGRGDLSPLSQIGIGGVGCLIGYALAIPVLMGLVAPTTDRGVILGVSPSPTKD